MHRHKMRQALANLTRESTIRLSELPLLSIVQNTINVMIEEDSEGWLVASVASLEGCYTQARNFEDLAIRVREVIELCTKDIGDSLHPLRFEFNA